MALFFIQVTSCKTCPSVLRNLLKKKKAYRISSQFFLPLLLSIPSGIFSGCMGKPPYFLTVFYEFPLQSPLPSKKTLAMPIGSFFVWLCYRKWLMLFSLKLQRDTPKNTLAVDPPRGKLEKRLYFSPHCGNETTTYITEPFVSATPHPQHSKIHNKSPENVPGLLLA